MGRGGEKVVRRGCPAQGLQAAEVPPLPELSGTLPSPPDVQSVGRQGSRHAVLTCRICTRPRSSGSPISTCTSRRPGRSSASSSMSRLRAREEGKSAMGART